MRLLFALVFVGACVQQDQGPDITSPPDNSGWGSGEGGGAGQSGFGCEMDSDCTNSNVCARDGECLPAADVRIIHVTWTLQGQAASATTCASSPDLEITFEDNEAGDQFGFAPVPCVEGKFTIDKLPTSYTEVSLARSDDYSGGVSGVLDRTTGDATLDLSY